ncbi:MAG TPA: phosphate acyltransferase PlsX [Dehalococcoidales bacterium]|nr:phosphate acyltransferase PlsX [Dehalococcoidales bacterium]
MRIAVDAMGGDYAPADVVKGAVKAAREAGLGVILVGQQDKIKTELDKYPIAGLDIEIVHTDEYLVEGEQPAYALRTKRQASIALATKLVRDGRAQAVLSAGPTGGVIASALMILGMVEGVSKPVLGGPFVGFAPNTVIMDVGGNVDVRPDQLLDFAIVGTVYARALLNIANPSVGLLSIGAEEGKGNELVKNAFPLFKKSGLNFIGNIEGYDIPTGKANVVVCDGFVGNVLVKFYECLGHVTAHWMEENLKGKMPEAEIKELCGNFLRLTNAAEAVGGGPIWAVNGLSIKAHGRSRADEIARAMAYVKELAEKDIVNALKKELADIRARLNVPNT